jgi:hypothetical protein
MTEYDDELFKAALNNIAASPEGQLVLAVLKESCGWDQVYLSSDNPQVTQYYAARRGVYGSIRQLIRPEHLKKIEFDYRKKVAQHDDRSASKHSSASRRAKPTTSQ